MNFPRSHGASAQRLCGAIAVWAVLLGSSCAWAQPGGGMRPGGGGGGPQGGGGGGSFQQLGLGLSQQLQQERAQHLQGAVQLARATAAAHQADLDAVWERARQREQRIRALRKAREQELAEKAEQRKAKHEALAEKLSKKSSTSAK
jgi:hypothetical protein